MEALRSHIAAETDPCAQSPLAWIEHAKPVIKAKADGSIRIVPFEPYDFQREVLADWDADRRICVKARQLGLSTTFALECYWVAKYRPNSVILVISIKEKRGVQFLDDVRFQVQQFGDELAKDTTTEIRFANGSVISVEGASTDPGRGAPATRIYLDEAAFMAHDEAMWASLHPALERGGKLTLNSTPRGDANVFADVWHGRKGSAWKKYRFDWRRLPRPDGWEDETRAQLSRQKFAQEHDCDFNASVEKRFRVDDIDACFDTATRSGPVEGRLYRIACDPAGQGRDYTVIQVWDRTESPYRLVHESRWQKDRYEAFYDEVERLARLYRPDAVHMDATGLGDPMREETEKRLKGVCKLIPVVFSPKTKPSIMEAVTLAVERKALRFHSTDLREEMRLFSDEDEKKLVTDCLMSCAIFCSTIFKPHTPARVIVV